MVNKHDDEDSLLNFTPKTKNESVIKKRLTESGVTVVKTPDWLPKISGAFIDFISPYEELLEDSSNRSVYIFLSVMAWNIGLMPKKHHKKQIHEVIDELKKMIPSSDPDAVEALKEMRDIMRDLIARKLEYFADDCRYIQDYQVSEEDGELKIAIASTFV